jgi:hypothetical protein
LKLPELPPVAIAVQVPPELEELLELELLLDELPPLEDELLLDDEEELLEDDELELEELVELDEPLPLSIVPAEAVSVILSSLAPSSRLRIRNA